MYEVAKESAQSRASSDLGLRARDLKERRVRLNGDLDILRGIGEVSGRARVQVESRGREPGYRLLRHPRSLGVHVHERVGSERLQLLVDSQRPDLYLSERRIDRRAPYDESHGERCYHDGHQGDRPFTTTEDTQELAEVSRLRFEFWLLHHDHSSGDPGFYSRSRSRAPGASPVGILPGESDPSTSL